MPYSKQHVLHQHLCNAMCVCVTINFSEVIPSKVATMGHLSLLFVCLSYLSLLCSLLLHFITASLLFPCLVCLQHAPHHILLISAHLSRLFVSLSYLCLYVLYYTSSLYVFLQFVHTPSLSRVATICLGYLSVFPTYVVKISNWGGLKKGEVMANWGKKLERMKEKEKLWENEGRHLGKWRRQRIDCVLTCYTSSLHSFFSSPILRLFPCLSLLNLSSALSSPHALNLCTLHSSSSQTDMQSH